MTDKKEKNEKFITPVLRCSFPSVFNLNEQSEKYEITLLIPKKEEEAFLKKLKSQVQKVAETAWGKENAKKILQNVKGTDFQTVKDGDNSDRDELKGHYYIKAKSGPKFAPGVVDNKAQPIMDADEVYGGCHVRASINFYTYEFKGNKGVAVGLKGIMKVKDDEPFAGFVSAADEFAEFADEAENTELETEGEDIF